MGVDEGLAGAERGDRRDSLVMPQRPLLADRCCMWLGCFCAWHLMMWAIHLTATSRVLKSLTSTVGFRGWVAVCGSGNEMDSPHHDFTPNVTGRV
jgi:hypothetical protein